MSSVAALILRLSSLVSQEHESLYLVLLCGMYFLTPAVTVSLNMVQSWSTMEFRWASLISAPIWVACFGGLLRRHVSSLISRYQRPHIVPRSLGKVFNCPVNPVKDQLFPQTKQCPAQHCLSTNTSDCSLSGATNHSHPCYNQPLIPLQQQLNLSCLVH